MELTIAAKIRKCYSKYVSNFSFNFKGKRIFAHLEFDDFIKYDISLANCVEDEELIIKYKNNFLCMETSF